MAGPGGTAEGFQPNFWQRLKGTFTGENPWDNQGMGMGANGFDQRAMYGYGATPYPGSFQQHHPMLGQIEQTVRMNEMVLQTQMVMGMMTQMSTMFFSPMGMFW